MISIFSKPAFLNTNPHNAFISKEKSYKGHGHLQRVSSMIRGDQIAEYLGAKLNPIDGYENDVCIYVKPHVEKDQDFKFEGKRSYLDIIDGYMLISLILKHPEVGVIVCSEADQKIMSKSVPNKIVLIPQHHCNFERIKRTRKEVKRVGVIGTRGAFPFLPVELKGELEKRGLELVEYSKFFSRQDIIDFYMSIDLQIVWRPYKKVLSNPLKIVNACSFGVPTIALREDAFFEMLYCHRIVHNFKELLSAVDDLIQPNGLYYEGFAERGIVKAEKYHISNIAKLYQKL